MTRAADVAPPTVPPPGHPPLYEVASRLVIALERLPQSAYTWDDADPAIVWEDAPLADLLEPFDDYTTNGWTTSGTPEIVAGRTGTAARLGAAGERAIYTIPNPSDTITLGFAYLRSDALTTRRDILELWGDTGATFHNRLRYTPATTLLEFLTGSTVLVTNTAVTFTQNVWYYLELQVKMHDTAGFVICRVDGVDVINVTNVDTRFSGAVGQYDALRLWSNVASTFNNYDDLYLTAGPAGTFLGPITIPPAVGRAYPTDLVWDAPEVGSGFTDAVCDFHSVTIESGPPDEDTLVPSAEAVITLANPAGEYSTLSADGRLVYWAPGRQVQILGVADGAQWWLFSGRVTGWDENPDGTVTITAHDGFARLAQDVGQDWTPGAASQTVAARVTAICSAWGYTDPLRLTTSPQLHANPPTDRSPLEECQVTALSDGGILFCDADGALTYWDRGYTLGRTDQTVVRTVSDNVCDGPLIVWDLATLTNDVGLASSVRLENWEEPPKVATATTTPNPWAVPYVWSHPEPDLWTDQADGNRLATDLLARYRNDAARFSFSLYLHAPTQDLWRAGIDLRLGDKVNLVRTFVAAGGGVGILDVDNLVQAVRHEITPEEWITTVETSRVIAYRYPLMWDAAPYTWDDPAARNVWSY